MKQESISIRFHGDDFLNANLLLSELNGLVNFVNEASQICKINEEVLINVDTPKKGSFILSIVIATLASDNGVLFETINHAKTIVDFIISCINLKKHLKGNKPAEIEQLDNSTIVKNHNNESQSFPTPVVNNYFSNCKVDTILTGMMSTANSYGRGDFDISGSTQDKPINLINEDMVHMKEKIDFTYETGATKEERVLYIRTPDLLGNKQWGFRGGDKDFNATIEDLNFLTKVKKGVHLYSGCSIRCILYSEFQLDYNNMPVEGSYKYKVIEVLGNVIEPPKQDRMF